MILDGGYKSSLLRHLLKILLCPPEFAGELHLSDMHAFIYWFAVCWLGQQELWTWSTLLAVSAWRTPDQKERGWRRPKLSTKVWVTLATSSWLLATRWVRRLAHKKRLQAHSGRKLMINWCSRFLQETPIPYWECKLSSKTGPTWFPQRCWWSLKIVPFCKGPSSPYRGKQVRFSKTGDHPHLYFLQDTHTPVRDYKSISAKQKDCESNNHPQLSLPFTGDPDPQQRSGVHFSKTDDHPHLDLLQGPHIPYKDCQPISAKEQDY